MLCSLLSSFSFLFFLFLFIFIPFSFQKKKKKSSMEFLLELFLTVFCSLALAFLFAKLLQKASVTEDVEQKQEKEKEEEMTTVSRTRTRRRKRSSEEKMISGFDGEVGKEEKSLGGYHELKNRGLEIEKRVAEVGGEAMVVDKFEGEEVVVVGLEGSEMGHGGGEVEGFELEKLVEVSAIGSKEEEIKIVQVEESPCEEEEEREMGICGEELAQEEEKIVAQDEHVEEIETNCEEKESLLSDEDDDWEGIERSEMEKIFGAASTFVGSGENNECLSKLGSDVQMQLYGLHKVANEGPCHETQPLAIMVSSRAKWHAWHRLGNMSPEIAMEAYIALLSDNVPEWMGKNPDGDNKQNTGTDSPKAEVSITKSDNLNSSPNQKPVPENERKQGVQSCDEGNDAMGGPEHQ